MEGASGSGARPSDSVSRNSADAVWGEMGRGDELKGVWTQKKPRLTESGSRGLANESSKSLRIEGNRRETSSDAFS